MSCSPCGFTYTTSPQFLMTGHHPPSSHHYPTPSSMPPDTLVSSHAHPGSSLCSLPYDSRLLGTAAAYPRLSELYNAAGYTDHVAYMGAHHPMLYPATLASPYDMKDPRAAAWASLPQTAGYEPLLAAYSPYGDRYDPVDSEARRRNATRETTSTLKAWLNEHRKNPYPTKGEKIMLAIITKMTLTQVSTWFANARRRLKKENKMTWEPRNKTGDDLDDVSIDEDEDKDPNDDPKSDLSDSNENQKLQEEDFSHSRRSSIHENEERRESPSPCRDTLHLKENGPNHPQTELSDSIKTDDNSVTEKPKIWSLAQTATSDSPPAQRKLLEQQSDLNQKLRSMGYTEHLYHPDIHHSSSYHRRLPQDSSAESSLSSPPLWRTGEMASFNHSDKFGRVTPLEAHELVTVSPTSSESPSVSSVSAEVSATSNVGYNRLLSGRFMPPSDNPQGLRQHPIDYGHFYAPISSIGHPLDIRTYQPTFLRTSSLTYPVGFTAAPTAMYHTTPPTAVPSKTKSDDEISNRPDS